MTDQNFVGQDIARMQELESTLNRGADELSRVRQDTFSVMNVLRSIWRGRVTEAFAQVWNGQHAPAIGNAEDSLRHAANIVRQNLDAQLGTSDTLFAGGAAAGGTVAGGAAGGTTVGGGEAGVKWEATQPGAFPSGRPTEEIFSEEAMTNFVGYEVPVADEARMNELMEALVNDELSGAELDDALVEMAVLRGQDPDDFRSQYEDYLGYREFAVTHNPKPQGVLDQSKHPAFLGGTASLRYGSVVGDALGIDPVFGALLNPSGGLVGPGGDAFEPADNDALGYHGIYHDAAGYLFNYQETGGGYDYLGREGNADPSNPLTGQTSGIRWWVANNPLLDVDGSEAYRLAGDDWAFLAPGNEVLHRAGLEEFLGQSVLELETFSRQWDGFGDILDGNFSEGFTEIGDASWDRTVGTVDNLWDFGSKQVDNTIWVGGHAVDGAQWVGGEVVDAGQWVGGHAVDGAQWVGGEVVDTGQWAGDSIVDGAEAIGDGAGWVMDGLGGLWP